MLLAGGILIFALSLIPYSLARNTLIRLKHAIDPRPESAATTTATATPSSAEPLFDVAQWYGEHGEQPETHGVLIESLKGDRTYASHNVDEIFNPASLIKLATSLVALRRLGPDFRFQIRVYADGEPDQ